MNCQATPHQLWERVVQCYHEVNWTWEIYKQVDWTWEIYKKVD